MKKIVEYFLNIAGKKNYSVSNDLSSFEIISLFFYRFFDLMRGLLLMLRIKESKFPVFRGQGGKIFFPKKLKAGPTLNIGQNVVINALCKKGIIIGKNFTIKSNSVIDCTGVLSDLGEGLVIGNNVGLSENCFLQVRGEVIIEDDVIFGPGVSIFSENHDFKSPNTSIKSQGVTRKGVKISSGCWLGANSIVLDGVELGKNCVVGAGSIVTKSFPDGSVVVGSPAKIINND